MKAIHALENGCWHLVPQSVTILPRSVGGHTRRTMSLLHGKFGNSLIGAVILPIALSACRTTPPIPPEHKSDHASEAKVQALQKEIRERDKRIEELESQLEALKLIEQDLEKQRKPIRPPTTLEPTQSP